MSSVASWSITKVVATLCVLTSLMRIALEIIREIEGLRLANVSWHEEYARFTAVGLLHRSRDGRETPVWCY